MIMVMVMVIPLIIRNEKKIMISKREKGGNKKAAENTKIHWVDMDPVP